MKKCTQHQRDVLAKAIKEYGTASELCRRLNLNRQTFDNYYIKRNPLPGQYALALDKLLVFASADLLRPDLYTDIMMNAQRKYWKKSLD